LVVPRAIGHTKGGLNSKPHAVCDGEIRPVLLLLTEGQQSGHKGAQHCHRTCRLRARFCATKVTTAAPIVRPWLSVAFPPYSAKSKAKILRNIL